MAAVPQNALQSSYDRGLKLASLGKHFEAIECFEQALAAAPSDTRVLFALGNTARALGEKTMARQFYSQVLALEPHRLEALINLANLLRGEGQFSAARALLEPALVRQPQSPELHLTLGAISQEEGDNIAAERLYRDALTVRPDYVPALSNLADLAADSGDQTGALALYDKAVKADPGNAQIRLNRAILYLTQGNLKEGWRDYAARTEIRGKVPETDLSLANWTGGSLRKTRLLVRSEQGVGDEIMFASLFEALLARASNEAGSVILECDKRLVAVFARSFPAATVHAAERKTERGRVHADYGWLKSVGGANAMTLAGSLPRYFSKALENPPGDHAYLKPDLAELVRWQGVFAGLGPSPVIGLCWRSGKSGGARALGYAPLAAWAEFIKAIPGALVCAQYDARPDEIAELEARSGRKIFAPALDQKNELDRTMAMLAALDILVSAPTAVAWLGASAGVKTLKMLYDKCWTSFGRAREPLAPSCDCVVPRQRGDWADVFSQAAGIIARA
jgi:tetratricopeptide (TPR) repeat protein